MTYSELRWSSPPLDQPVSGDVSMDDLLKQRLSLCAEKTALIVVDVQPEYWSECPAVRKDFPQFPENMKRTIETCRKQGAAKVVFVRADYRFSHSPWLVQFARIHQGKSPDTNPQLTEIRCDPDSDEFKWEEFAEPQGNEVIIPKSSWASTSNTALIDLLKASGIDTVLVCGLITSVCVQHSAFGLFESGFRTLLVTDACADRSRARHDAALALYGDYMYELVTSKEISDPQNGLLRAKPRWLTLKNKNSQCNRSFENLQSKITKNEQTTEAAMLSGGMLPSPCHESDSIIGSITLARAQAQLGNPSPFGERGNYGESLMNVRNLTVEGLEGL